MANIERIDRDPETVKREDRSEDRPGDKPDDLSQNEMPEIDREAEWERNRPEEPSFDSAEADRGNPSDNLLEEPEVDNDAQDSRDDDTAAREAQETQKTNPEG